MSLKLAAFVSDTSRQLDTSRPFWENGPDLFSQNGEGASFAAPSLA